MSMNNIPEFKKELKRRLSEISRNRDFIVTVGTLAGGTKEDADRLIYFMDSNPDATAHEIKTYATRIWVEHELAKQSK